MNIKDYGWNNFFEQEWRKNSDNGMIPGRITADYGQIVHVMTETGEVAVSRPADRREGAILIEDDFLHFAVGDWVAMDYSKEAGTYRIRSVLPRRTKFSRAAAGIELKEQIVAANVDTVFLIQSLNRDFNIRRLERYMVAAWDSGAVPVVVLTKADCCSDVNGKTAMVYAAIPGVEVHAVSCVTGEGIDGIRKYLEQGKTIALLGSSGVGKSTLLNYLAGKKLLKTGEIREYDDRGRHTTTHRELVLLESGGLILDTPGMRSLSLWESDTGMETMFGDIEEIVKRCRFHDCKHRNEPGCAVRTALSDGTLDRERWESWLKLQKEQINFERRSRMKQKIREKQRLRQMAGNRDSRQKIKAGIKNMDLELLFRPSRRRE